MNEAAPEDGTVSSPTTDPASAAPATTRRVTPASKSSSGSTANRSDAPSGHFTSARQTSAGRSARRVSQRAATAPRPGSADRREATEHEWLDRFNAMYRDAAGDHAKVPWSHANPSPSLVQWLDMVGPGLISPEARVAVVGCGLGSDAAAVSGRGYDVTAFDASVEAVRWARRLHPGIAHCFRVIDLLTLPDGMRHRFDLVVEVHTLQALPPTYRGSLARHMSALLAPGGVLVAIARGRSDAEPLEQIDGPPFAFTADELRGTLRSAGLEEVVPMTDALDANKPPVRRLTATFARPAV